MFKCDTLSNEDSIETYPAALKVKGCIVHLVKGIELSIFFQSNCSMWNDTYLFALFFTIIKCKKQFIQLTSLFEPAITWLHEIATFFYIFTNAGRSFALGRSNAFYSLLIFILSNLVAPSISLFSAWAGLGRNRLKHIFHYMHMLAFKCRFFFCQGWLGQKQIRIYTSHIFKSAVWLAIQRKWLIILLYKPSLYNPPNSRFEYMWSIYSHL